MFLLLFFLSFSSEVCHSQMMYSRMVPYDPRYVLHRPPARRSAMEALERLRMPVARYFPQVDTQVASAPYELPVPPRSSYRLSPYENLALFPQWTDDGVQQLPHENDYGNYEDEGQFYSPGNLQAEDYFSQAAIQPDNAYNDYIINDFDNVKDKELEQFELQRRSESPAPPNKNQGVIALTTVLEANKNAVNNNKNVTSGSDTTVPPAAAEPSPVPPQVQMTAVPSAPEKKEIKSLVIPEPVADNRVGDEDGMWREVGQKEEPLFRPLQNSQRTTWEVLTRAKNSLQKRPIPMLKKMIQGNSQQQTIVDPLTEELKNLKKEHGV